MNALENSSPEEGLLRQLFSRFEQHGIRYAVMRNFQTLPFSAGDSDLDIIVAISDASRARALVLESIHSAGGVPIGIAESMGFYKVSAIGRVAGLSGRDAWWGICLDINVGLFFQGMLLLDDEFEWPRKVYRGINVLAEGFAGVLGVLKEVLNNGHFPARYAIAARDAALHEWPQMETLLSPMGRQALARLRSMLLSRSATIELRCECRKFRREMMRHSMSHRGLLWLVDRAAYEWSKIRRYLTPSGMVVAFLGVDGAGKSTLINSILPALSAATHNAVRIRHLRPTVLPPLARLKGSKHDSSGAVQNPHGSTVSGKLGSMLRLTYLTLDYFIGYWLWTRCEVAKQPTVVIFDRYAYDMVLDPRRFRIALSPQIISLMARLAPKPDLIFCLHGSPEVLASRKGELTLAEIRRQVDAIRTWAATQSNAVLIATDGNVEEARDHILSAVMNFCAKRGRRMHGD
jgi:thymidylate kinase